MFTSIKNPFHDLLQVYSFQVAFTGLFLSGRPLARAGLKSSRASDFPKQIVRRASPFRISIIAVFFSTFPFVSIYFLWVNIFFYQVQVKRDLIGRLRCISQSKRSKQVLLGRRFNMADGSVQPIFSIFNKSNSKHSKEQTKTTEKERKRIYENESRKRKL